jgi:hypothetical protein
VVLAGTLALEERQAMADQGVLEEEGGEVLTTVIPEQGGQEEEVEAVDF